MIEEIRNSRPEVTIPEVLEQDFENDLDLRHLCRAAIRKHLLYLDPHSHLFDRVLEARSTKVNVFLSGL